MLKLHPFRIVTAYEDRAAGLHAREMAQRLSAELKLQVEIENDVWKFELLSHPRLREYATADAVSADMVVISACGARELPPHVCQWIEAWAANSDRPRALVALLDQDENLPGMPPPLSGYLRQIAESHHMDFYCKAGDWLRHDFEYMIDTVHQRSRNRVVVLEEMLHQELRAQLRPAAVVEALPEWARAAAPAPGSELLPLGAEREMSVPSHFAKREWGLNE